MNFKFLRTILRFSTAILLMFLLISVLPAQAAPGETTRVSVDSNGAQANNYSKHSVISGDGRYVAFESEASNLVNGDTNGTGDLFVHDNQTGATTRVSVDSSGVQANAWSGSPAISSDGRFVVFYSDANNLVVGDTNGFGDIFIHDRQTGQTTRVSVDSSGNEANKPSSDYYGDTTISGDGRYVGFQSDASNLVSGDTNGLGDIFVHDRQTGQTNRVSVDSSGTEANGSSSSPVISNDGRYVAFSSSATNLVSEDTNGVRDVFVHDLQTRETTRVSVNSSGEQADGGGGSPAISGDGRFVVFLSDSNNLAPGTEDYEHLVYLHDRQSGQTTLASIYSDGEIMVGTLDEPSISSNGRCVAFSFYEKGNGQGLQEIFVRDLQMGESIQVTQGGVSSEDSSFRPTLSADGSMVAFWSLSNILVSGDTNGVSDVFVYENVNQPGPPSVVSVSRVDPSPTGNISVAFTVTFSEAVSGVDLSDYSLTVTGSITGASITDVSGSGNTYTVTINTGSGDGSLHLDILDDDSIMNIALVPLGGAGAGNGDFTSGEAYTVDKSAPVVAGSLRSDPNPAALESVHFTVTFSEEVSGVDSSDFSPTTTGGISGASIANVSGSGNTYTVTVSTGSGDGTLRLDVLDNDTIMDAASQPLGGAGAGNGDYDTGEGYIVDKSVPVVTSSLLADPNPTVSENVHFTIIFSETVSGVDPSDFSPTTTGGLSGASITGVSGSGNTYTVTVSTGSGDGTLRLDVVDNDSIIDAVGHPLGGVGSGNGNFTSGQAYTINKSPVTTYTSVFRSNGRNDGWVLESSEDSNQGGFTNANAPTFYLGDDALDRQFRAVLHFPTFYLPNNAVITRAVLFLKGVGVIGSDPFNSHQNILIDIRNGSFGPFSYRSLQPMDFQSTASRDAVGMIQNNPIGNWYWTSLDSSAFPYINLSGVTQLRLRFQIDDNDDLSNNILVFYSGNYQQLRDRPHLLIEYYKQR